MKIFIQSPHAKGDIDGTVRATLLDFLPNQVGSAGNADVTIVPISMYGDYRFNEEFRKITGKWVMLDYLELEWCASTEKPETHLFGKNTRDFRWVNTPEWIKLCDWAAQNPPIAYFKRELFRKDRSDTVFPVEFPCRLPIPPIESREQFHARPIEVFFSWGYSSPSRPRLHGDIFKGMADNGLDIISEWDQKPPHPGKRTWMTVYSPYYTRKPIEEIMRWQTQSKISISLPGAGQKCFRSGEAPVGSIMALHEDDLAWSCPWVGFQNCIRLDPSIGGISQLDSATQDKLLYDIYVESQRTIHKYRSENYVMDYIMPAIESHL